MTLAVRASSRALADARAHHDDRDHDPRRAAPGQRRPRREDRDEQRRPRGEELERPHALAVGRDEGEDRDPDREQQ
jgi:hypothetical protein